jgi:acyl carrier protein
VSIGRPIANTQIYLLDSHLQPVPIGVPGELYIGGAGLARGYLNRPELTAQKFIPNPFSSEPSSRLYKTGDLARYLPDGNIEFIGRIDHQVKIRGFRIELGEIEAVLRQHPAVQETVVLDREDVPGDKRLVAYVVPHQEQSPTSSELRHFLKEQLPEYMVPSAFVTLETLPLTPNGKVDRRALPNQEGLRPDLEPTYVAPQTEVERSIATVWQEVLHVENVGVHDNFFDLGGHSLLMVKIQTKLQEVVNRDVSMTELFKYPTINSLARYLIQEQVEQPSFHKLNFRVKKQKEAIKNIKNKFKKYDKNE